MSEEALTDEQFEKLRERVRKEEERRAKQRHDEQIKWVKPLQSAANGAALSGAVDKLRSGLEAPHGSMMENRPIRMAIEAFIGAYENLQRNLPADVGPPPEPTPTP